MRFLGIEIPRVSVHLSKADALQHGNNIKIVCNLSGDWIFKQTTLTRISWYKDGILKRNVENPDNNNLTLGPLVIKSAGVRDGGNYTCLLEVLLRHIKEHNVSDSSMINSEFSCATLNSWPIHCDDLAYNSHQLTVVVLVYRH